VTLPATTVTQSTIPANSVASPSASVVSPSGAESTLPIVPTSTLAFTGANIAWLLTVALIVLALGALLLLLSTRATRRSGHSIEL
jgi:hypothetical protein